MLMVAPVTSNLKAARFSFTVRIEPSSENGLTESSIIMVFQMRAIDKARVVRKLGSLSNAELDLVDSEIWKMLKP